jgi:hypothetical protein
MDDDSVPPLKLDPTKVAETRAIKLANGDTLEVQMTEGFVNRVKQHFALFGDQVVEDAHVKQYLFDVASTAVDKAERELNERGTTARDS